MSILDSLFSGAKVFVKQFVTVLGDAVRVVLEEIDRSPFGKAAAGLVHGFTRKYFSQAEELAAEEREFGEKFKRDGKRSEQDEERLREMQAERERLQKQMEAAKAKEAAEEFKSDSDKVIAAEMTDDEMSSAVGILSSKKCGCGGTMRIRQSADQNGNGKRSFYWQCTMTNRLYCPTIKLNANDLKASVLRKENPDLDGDTKTRKQIWTMDDVSIKAHSRLRQNHLGENDEEVVCPHHLLPMKLVQKGRNDGLMLSSYEYICMAIHSDGRACSYTVGLETYPQVAAMLRRREGKGIIDG